MNGLSLFSGIGGLDLAFEWAGGTVAAMCEIEPYCQKVLRKHWPRVPLFEDVRELRNTSVGTIDIIYGGFPCQPFSMAGNRKGQDDNRYLWPEFSRLVSEIKPRWIVAENVPGILSIAADDVCSDLDRQGYSVGIWDFEAAAVGAPHRRERIFFVAHAGCKLLQRLSKQRNLREKAERRLTVDAELSSGAYAPYTHSERREEQQQQVKGQTAHPITRCNSRRSIESRLGGVVNGFSAGLDGNGLTFWEVTPEPRERTVKDGNVPNRVSRLKALGNAVVPQQAYPVFKAIIDMEKEDN